MAKLVKSPNEQKIRVLKNLMEGDRIEICFRLHGNAFLPIKSRCVYFARWEILEKIIMFWEDKYDDRPTLLHDALPLRLEEIIEIKKLTPTR